MARNGAPNNVQCHVHVNLEPVENMKYFIAASLLAVATLVALPGNAQAQLLPQYQTAHLDGIVAVVNNEVVLESELSQAMATVKRQFSGDPSQLPPANVLKQQVLDRLVLQDLQVQRARRMGIRIAQGEVRRAVAGIAQKNNVSTRQMATALSQRGSSMAAFQQQIAEQIMVQKLRQQVLRQKVHVTESEIDNLLNSPAFNAGEVHLAHIVIPVPQGAGAAEIAAARQQATKVARAVATGMDFTTAAMRWSQAPDALEGGDLGWRSMSEMSPQFAELLAGMQPGDVTAPLRDPGAFQIFKVIDTRESAPTIVTQYHARHIAIRPDALTTETQAQRKIEQLRQRIVDGEASFKDVAQAESEDDTTANTGGDMGWFQINDWGTAVATQLKLLDDGEVSPPFKAGGAWHIIKRLGSREKDRTTEARRERARLAIENRKAKDVYDNFLRQLRAEAYVDVRVGKPGDSTSSKTS